MKPKKLWGVYLLASLLILRPVFLAYAENPVETALREQSKAIVSIGAYNTTVVQGKPEGIFDPNTGQILIIEPMRPIAYARTGSGTIIHPSGVIVTNAHTIEGAGGIMVTLFDGTKAPVKHATLVPDTDIAFVTIDPPFPLHVAPLVNLDSLVTGNKVYIVGNSDSIKGGLFEGTLNRIGRGTFDGKNYAALLDMTFPVHFQKGDSGSPIFDPHGKFLGMLTAGQTMGNTIFAIGSNVIAAAYQTHRAEWETAP